MLGSLVSGKLVSLNEYVYQEVEWRLKLFIQNNHSTVVGLLKKNYKEGKS